MPVRVLALLISPVFRMAGTMNARTLVAAVGALSPQIILRALTRPRDARHLLSQALHDLDEISGRGLPTRSAVLDVLMRQDRRDSCVTLPLPPWDNGGTSVKEIAVLAGVTALIRPERVFEIGTFSGLATSAFVLNGPPTMQVFTMDLPPDPSVAGYLEMDADLVRDRKVGEIYLERGFQDRVTQILCDSMKFDPTPYANSIRLAFIDGAHTREHVENDTRKVAQMMRPDGMIFWHDYGGRGSLAGVTDYLNDLAKGVTIYREPNTTLAWAHAGPLKHAV